LVQSQQPAGKSILEIYLTNLKAGLAYAPHRFGQSCQCPITLFRSDRSQLLSSKQDEHWGWDALTTAHVEVRHIPGNHMNMMRMPHVKVLAQELTACLAAVTETSHNTTAQQEKGPPCVQ
jgi:thioesterase domain-containing protein